MNGEHPLVVVCSRKELSCIIANLFAEVKPICEVCEALGDDELVMCGTVAGTDDDYAYIKVTADGFEFYGDNEVIHHIREARCHNGTVNFAKKDGGAAE